MEPIVALEVEPEKVAEWTIVKVEGELDSATYPALTRFVEELVKDRTVNVALDLENLNFIDSSGLSAFLQAEIAIERGGGKMALLRPTRIVQKVLDITGMATYFTVHDSPESLFSNTRSSASADGGLPPEVWVG